MAGPGYNTGFLEGMKGAADLQTSQDVHQERMQQMMMNDFNLKSSEFELKQKQLAYATQEQEKKLMANLFNFSSIDKNSKDDFTSASSLAAKYLQAGQRLMGMDPDRAIALTKVGEDLKHKAVEDKVKSTELVAQRREALASLFLGVSDQGSLNDTVEEASKLGSPIPPKYRIWNDETKEFLQQRAKGSKLGVEMARLQNTVDTSNLNRSKTLAEINRKDEKENLEERKFAWQKESKEAALHNKAYTEPKDEVKAGFAKTLKAQLPEFSHLDPQYAGLAVDYYARAAFSYQRGGITDINTAYAMAAEDVRNAITKDGEFKPKRDLNTSAKSSSKTGSKEAQPLPKSASEAKVGVVYETEQGPARWNGKQFEPIE